MALEAIPSKVEGVLLRVKHRRYECTECSATFYELLKGIDSFAKITNRLRDYIMEQAQDSQLLIKLKL